MRQFLPRRQNLFAVKEPKALSVVKSANQIRSLVAQRFDGIKTRGLDRGPHSENESDGDADGEAGHGRPYRDNGIPIERPADDENEAIHDDQRDDAAHTRQRHGLEQELPDDVAAPRSDGLANSDFAGALGDAHQHDVHYPDTADEQPNGAEDDHRESDHAYDVVELVHGLLRRLDGKIVLIAVMDVAPAAQDVARLVHGLINQRRRKRLDADVVFVGRGIDLAESIVGNQDPAVFIVRARATLGFLQDDNHLESRSVNQDVVANGVACGKHDGRDVFAEDHHLLAVQVFRLGEKAPFAEIGIGIDLRVIREHAAEVNGAHIANARANRVAVLTPTDPHRGVFYRRTARLNRFPILEGQRLAQALFLGEAAVVRPLVKTRDEGGVRAELHHV